MRLVRKIIAKLKRTLNPKGYSHIMAGPGKGLLWAHEISDLRYLTGEYEPETANYILQKIQSGYSFIDVGANAGYYSLLAASQVNNPSQKIIAVEPMDKNISQINNHSKLNKISRIEVLPFAVSDTNQELEFSASENLAANTYNSESEFFKSAPKIKIQAKTLDTICRDYKFGKLLLKIDVEGAEADVLKGAAEVITKHHPEIILATHECHVKGVEQECLNILINAGYKCLKIDEQKYVKGQQDYVYHIPKN